MASGRTPIQGYPYPLESDAPDVAADIYQLTLALEVVAQRLSGLASAMPLATAVPVGTRYYQTDTNLTYESDGTLWHAVLIAGAWQTLTLPSGVAARAFFYAPAARREGDIVRLRGAVENTSSSTWAAGTTIFNLPTNCEPAAGDGVCVLATMMLYGPNPSAIPLAIAGSACYIQSSTAVWTSTGVLVLDGITYSAV